MLGLDLETGLRLILKAKEQERDARLFQQWCVQLPMMAMSDNAIGFNDYRDRVTGANIDTRSTKDILAELDDVEKQFTKGANNGA